MWMEDPLEGELDRVSMRPQVMQVNDAPPCLYPFLQ